MSQQFVLAVDIFVFHEIENVAKSFEQRTFSLKDMIMKEKMCTLRYIAAFSYLPKVRLFERKRVSRYSQHSLAKVFWASINRENNAAKTKLWSLALVTEHYTRGQARLTGQGVWGCMYWLRNWVKKLCSIANWETVLRLFFCAVWLTLMERCFFSCCSPLYIRITYIVKRQLTNAPDDSAVFSCFWQDKFTCQFSQFT